MRRDIVSIAIYLLTEFNLDPLHSLHSSNQPASQWCIRLTGRGNTEPPLDRILE